MYSSLIHYSGPSADNSDRKIYWQGGGITFLGKIETPNEGTFIRIAFDTVISGIITLDTITSNVDTEFVVTHWLPAGKIIIEVGNGTGNNTPQFTLLSGKIS